MANFCSYMVFFLLSLSLVCGYSGFSPNEIGSGEAVEFEPAAAVYEIMNRRLVDLESRLEEMKRQQELQCQCQNVYTDAEVDQITLNSKKDILNAVDKKLDEMKKTVLKSTQVLVSDRLDSIKQTKCSKSDNSKDHVLEESSMTSPPSRILTTTPEPLKLKGCDEVAAKGFPSGVYTLEINRVEIQAYCEVDEMDGTAWLVIQRRQQGDIFYRGYQEYKDGFGALDGGHWLGLEKIHKITSKGRYELRVDLTDKMGNTAFTTYSGFRLSGELDGYRLNYSGVIADMAGDSLIPSRGQMFSTYDNDRDGSILYNCARLHKGAFWYNKCGNTNLNGLLPLDSSTVYSWQNVHWFSWYKDTRSLTGASMKIRLSE